jgi:hypothetical protein
MPVDVTINLGDANNPDKTEAPSTKVTFHNSETVSIDLTMPEKGSSSCFAPPPTSPQTLAVGTSVGPYTITGNAVGNYDYSWKPTGTAELATRTGRIVID